MAGCLGFHAALTSTSVDEAAGSAVAAAVAVLPPSAASPLGANARDSRASDAERARALCRGLGAMQTLGALCALCPEALAQRLPPQLAPLFAPRIQPVLLRALRYLSFFADRCAVL